MDPNRALAELRELIAEYESTEMLGLDLADAIVGRFTELDEWLSRGGFPPADWRAAWHERSEQ